MFQTFISRHNSNFFSDKLVLTSVTPASSAPVLQTPKATSSTLYFDSLTVNAGNGGFLHCIQMDTSVNAANQVVSVGADIAFDADPKFFACLVRFESSSVPTTLLLSLLLPSLLIMFIPSTFKRPVSSWKALNLRKTLLMASSVRLKPLNCSRLPCVYAQETLTFLLTQKKTCVKNYVQKE